MQAKIISRTRTNTEHEHTTDPEQTGLERKVIIQIRLDDMPHLPAVSYARAGAPGWVPDYATVTEVLYTWYGDDTASHYRIVESTGHLIRKDGTVGKQATNDTWGIYSLQDEEKLPAALREALTQVVPAFDKGILP